MAETHSGVINFDTLNLGLNFNTNRGPKWGPRNEGGYYGADFWTRASALGCHFYESHVTWVNWAGTPTKIATSHRNPGKLDSGQLKLDVEFAE
ncbi:hypothetical protein [Methyloversatilis sp.]|uniref:hypothetical protein n=1 Tax=Methyloversatilis sp. TaxID=2569862 RepID=UPI0035AFD626